MNPLTKEMIEVMQAYCDGKEIQYRGGDECPWEPILTPGWDWVSYDYRIKPEPKEIWVNEYSHGRGHAYGTKGEANLSTDTNYSRRAVKYREVIDE